ncbi:hypothetical protein N0V85_001930 [Neurospora sp. IMI 360204]|nr:hypothetical protein N0V85_001930 [Neurospora sp. IMI 360204]
MPPKLPGLRCYATLGVSPYADSKALVSAYRRLALQTHPDKNNNTVEANEKFKESQPLTLSSIENWRNPTRNCTT